MTTRRLSLSSSAIKGRVKKYDRYIHDSAISQRSHAQSSTRIVGSEIIADTAHRSRNTQSNRTARLRGKQTHKGRQERSMKRSMQDVRPVLSSRSRRRITPATDKQSKQPVETEHTLALKAVATSRSTITHAADVAIHDYIELSRPKQSKSRRSILQKLVYASACAVFILAAVASIGTLRANRATQEQLQNVLGQSTSVFVRDEQGVEQGTGSQPAEAPVTDTALKAHAVASPQHPKYLRIPQLSVEARIKQLGTQDGAVDAPWNIHDVGWYQESALPGSDVGASLLLGHVSGWTEDGVFKDLARLQPGDTFTVERGSGEVVTYSVVRAEHIPLAEVDMSQVLRTETAGEHDIKLMTCSGAYNSDLQTYEERTVVYARVV